MKRLLFLLTACCLLLVPVAPAAAADAGSGLRISPVRQDVTLKPGSSQSVAITVQNLTTSDVTVQSVVSDFTSSSDESGQPQLLLDPKTSSPARSFKSLTQGIDPFTLAANQRATVPLELTVPQTAAAGGYYGAIRFAASSDTTSQGTTLTASTGTIFLVTVSGKITQKLSIASIGLGQGSATGRFFLNPPTFAQVRFQNQGNIHVQPFGKLVVKNWPGKVIDQQEVNNTDPRGSVLPGSIRKFGVDLQRNAKVGVYSLEGSFSYGTSGQVLTAKQHFVVIPYQLLIAIGIIILLLVFVVPLIVKLVRRRRAKQRDDTAV